MSIVRLLLVTAASLLVSAVIRADPAPQPHNVVIFVADGLRSSVVTAETAPELEALRRAGVDFRNSHSLYPTFTTVNASAIATGHYIGDTGNFGNVIWVGPEPLPAPINSTLAYLGNNMVLGLLNQRFGGNYLGETSLIAAAREAGYSTAVLGKLGPAAIQDVTARDGQTVIIDDATGWGAGALPLPAQIDAAMRSAGLGTATPKRPTFSGGYVDRPNIAQQQWLTDVASKVLLPHFKAAGKPFVLLFWSRDPDISQHGQCDEPCDLVPGINGATSMAAIANASATLGRLRAALQSLGLDQTTNIFVTADHGFSTISKQSGQAPGGVLKGGFVAADLARALGLPLFDGRRAPVDPSSDADGVFIGHDPGRPEVVVVGNGGSDLIYLPGKDRRLARRVVTALAKRDYTGSLFLDDALGRVPGALPLSSVGLKGAARTPTPSIVIGFRSFTTGCAEPAACTVEVADDPSHVEGQGMHGSFHRGDTHNFMAAIGPDFKLGYVDPAPVSNADIAPTLAHLLGLQILPRGELTGRLLGEALKGGASAEVTGSTQSSAPAPGGFRTVLRVQSVGATSYYDAAGMPGRVVGLEHQAQ